MIICTESIKIFQEAINHCRWKTVLNNIISDMNIIHYKNKTFEEIMIDVFGICNTVKGIGLLTIYDITSSLCRYYKINIDKVYIIGNGPKRAIKLLNIKTKIHKIGDKIKIKYVDILDIINAFNINYYEIYENIKNIKNGDELETYICNWQKTK